MCSARSSGCRGSASPATPTSIAAVSRPPRAPRATCRPRGGRPRASTMRAPGSPSWASTKRWRAIAATPPKRQAVLAVWRASLSTPASPATRTRMRTGWARAALSCHSPQGWRVISASFEHERTAFPLTGAHRKVSCDQCHKTEASTSRRVFRGTAFQSCTACHRDSHAGRLGQSCTTCHTTQSWSAASATFDHSKSGYPLLGRHAAVKCAECHAAGRPRRLAHAACTDCRSDHHLGQLARRADGGRCEACHDVSGFAQPRFSAIDHEKTPFPLPAPIAPWPATNAIGRCPSSSCAPGRCGSHGQRGDRAAALPVHHLRDLPHRSPRRHDGAGTRGVPHLSPYGRVAHRGVRPCRHGLSLQGAHAAVACAGCHAREGSPRTARASVRFGGAPTGCTDCHKDRHEGRFAREGTTTCTRCHQPTRWADVRFDHDRETRFVLDGAHVRVACARCHRDAAGVARYRGLPLTCAGCHRPLHEHSNSREPAVRRPRRPAGAGHATGPDASHRPGPDAAGRADRARTVQRAEPARHLEDRLRAVPRRGELAEMAGQGRVQARADGVQAAAGAHPGALPVLPPQPGLLARGHRLRRLPSRSAPGRLGLRVPALPHAHQLDEPARHGERARAHTVPAPRRARQGRLLGLPSKVGR